MTPENKKKIKDTSQVRALLVMSHQPTTEPRIKSDYYVEGYAARYEPYTLWETEEGAILEEFRRGCFDGCDMSDIILQYDHEGKVLARTSNGTLIVEVDENGLFVAADLSKTEASRELYNEIKTGMVTKMSWRFTVGEYDYDTATRTFIHHKVKKIYDVSAVSIPANNDTEINARSLIDGVINLRARSEAELDDKRRRLKLKLKLEELKQ